MLTKEISEQIIDLLRELLYPVHVLLHPVH